MNRNIIDEWKAISEQPRIAWDVIALLVFYIFLTSFIITLMGNFNQTKTS